MFLIFLFLSEIQINIYIENINIFYLQESLFDNRVKRDTKVLSFLWRNCSRIVPDGDVDEHWAQMAKVWKRDQHVDVQRIFPV